MHVVDQCKVYLVLTKNWSLIANACISTHPMPDQHWWLKVNVTRIIHQYWSAGISTAGSAKVYIHVDHWNQLLWFTIISRPFKFMYWEKHRKLWAHSILYKGKITDWHVHFGHNSIFKMNTDWSKHIAPVTMCSLSGIGGYRTNHSLTATAATWLYQAGLDEKLVVENWTPASWSLETTNILQIYQLEQVLDILNVSHRALTFMGYNLMQPLQTSIATSNEQVNSFELSLSQLHF